MNSKGISPRHAAYACAFIGAVSLWWFLPSPGAAQAKPVVSPGVVKKDVTLSPPPDAKALADRIRERGERQASPALPGELRDLFHLERAAPVASVRSRAEETPVEEKAAPPTFTRSLQGVMLGEERMASIDGQLYREGAIIDGFELLRIEREWVQLRKDGTDVVLRIPRPGQK